MDGRGVEKMIKICIFLNQGILMSKKYLHSFVK